MPTPLQFNRCEVDGDLRTPSSQGGRPNALGGRVPPRSTGRVAALAFVFALAALPAFAADDDKVIFPGNSAQSETASAPKSGSLNSVTLAAGLILAGAGAWFVWRNRRAAPLGQAARSLAIDETRSLGNRQFLVVASYEGKKFLLGVCPGRISLLSPLRPAGDDEDDDELPHS